MKRNANVLILFIVWNTTVINKEFVENYSDECFCCTINFVNFKNCNIILWTWEILPLLVLVLFSHLNGFFSKRSHLHKQLFISVEDGKRFKDFEGSTQGMKKKITAVVGYIKQFYWKMLLCKSWCLPLRTLGYLDECPFFALKAAKPANIFNYPLTASNDYANMIS